MLSKKLFHLVHKIALFAILFASLAPSISHAFANNSASFAQEICSSNGKKITIQVLTTKGAQLATDFSVPASKDKTPVGIQHHLQHCPFCSAGAAVAVLPSQPLAIIALLEITAQKLAIYAAPIVASTPFASPPSQAPPSL
jgi:Protein of unknown function (DUF2946)